MGTIHAHDLFSGARGWSVGAEALGIIDHGVECMPEANATAAAAGFSTIHDDVWTFDPTVPATDDEVYVARRAAGDSHQVASIVAGLIASPPCQTFSAAGKGKGREALDQVLEAIYTGAYRDRDQLRAFGEQVGDDRTALVLTPLHFATTYNYRWLAWEQVPTVLPVWEACAEVLRAEGWSVWTGCLQAEQYGVPQTRKRAFLLASRDHEVTPPAPTHSRYYSRTPDKLDEGVLPWVSMAEALGWGMLRRPSPTVTGGGTETGGAEPIGHLSRYTARDDWVPRPPDQPHSVRIAIHEAGVLQSFPPDYQWQGSKTRQYLQCGNAVPPVLARAALSAVVPATHATVTDDDQAELQAVPELDPVASLRHSTEYLTHELPELIDACTDPQGADLAQLLLDLRELRSQLAECDDEVEQALRKAMPGDQLYVPGVLRADRRRGRDRKEWRHTDWQRDVRDKVLRRHGLLGVHLVDADGQELDRRLLYTALTDAQHVHAAAAPKVTGLKSVGLDPDDYCSTLPGRVTVTVSRDLPTEQPADERQEGAA